MESTQTGTTKEETVHVGLEPLGPDGTVANIKEEATCEVADQLTFSTMPRNTTTGETVGTHNSWWA
jgi:hypothetical protein